MKKDVKFNKERASFSKKIKRKILTEIACFKPSQEVFKKYAFDTLEEITKDKKYIPKLIHKWKKEIYSNKERLNFLNYDIDEKTLDEEIENIGTDSEIDDIFDNLEEKLRIDILKFIK